MADGYNHRIRKITPAGVVTTFAGSGSVGHVDGTGTAARFNLAIDVALASDGTLYVSESFGNKLRAITPAGVVTTLAGDNNDGFTDGTGTASRFDQPLGIDLGPDGNLYVADSSNNAIRKVTPAGVVSTLAEPARASAGGVSSMARAPRPGSTSPRTWTSRRTEPCT